MPKSHEVLQVYVPQEDLWVIDALDALAKATRKKGMITSQSYEALETLKLGLQAQGVGRPVSKAAKC